MGFALMASIVLVNLIILAVTVVCIKMHKQIMGILQGTLLCVTIYPDFSRK